MPGWPPPGATSGGIHIVDPRTGRPVNGLASVTVLAPDLATADAYSTAVFALGLDGIGWLRGRTEVDAMVSSDDRRVFTTEGFDRYRCLQGADDPTLVQSISEYLEILITANGSGAYTHSRMCL